jgi:glycosyltransferase involved in cell wall biosynthesis
LNNLSKEPLVSVLIPVKNGSRFIDEAVESIISQTWKNLEIIIIDDGSSDDTMEKLKLLAAKDTRIELQKSQGTGFVDALHQAATLAKGSYLARMDADDICLPNRLSTQMKIMMDRPDLVVLGTAAMQIDEVGREHGIMRMPSNSQTVRKQLRHSSCVIHPSVIMRSEAFKKCGGFRKPFMHALDYDLWLRMSRIGEIGNLPKILMYYRVHEESVTANNGKKQALKSAAAIAADALRNLTESHEFDFIAELSTVSGLDSLLEKLQAYPDIRRQAESTYWRIRTYNSRNRDNMVEAASKNLELLIESPNPSRSELFEFSIRCIQLKAINKNMIYILKSIITNPDKIYSVIIRKIVNIYQLLILKMHI